MANSKLSYHMKDMPVGVAPEDLSYLTAVAWLTEPADLDIEFAYTPERLAEMTKPNGDPNDEPGEQEDLVVTSVSSKHALTFRDEDEGITVIRDAGRNMLNYLTDPFLDQLEIELVREVRKCPDLSRLDAYLANRE